MVCLTSKTMGPATARTVILVMIIVLTSPPTVYCASMADGNRTVSRKTAEFSIDVGDRVAAILAPRQKAVLSAEVSRRVIAINKELGERFDEGEVLIQLEDSIYQVNVRTSEAALESAKSELANIQRLMDQKTRLRHADAILAAAEANLTATQRLHSDNHASNIDLENAKRDMTVARTNRELVTSTSTKELTDAKYELTVASGKLNIATERLRACTIVGPWNGRVTRAFVSEHELVDRGAPVIEVIDDRILLAKFLLPSSVFGLLHVGQELHLVVVETSQTVVVNVSHIAAALDPASVTFEVHAEVNNTDGAMRAGMNGWLSLAEIKGR